MTNNVLFLDIDGVLNSTRYYEVNKPLPMGTAGAIDPESVALLNLITVHSDVFVVLCTSWRMQGLERVKGYLQARGFKGRIIGSTPTLARSERAAEIREWLMQADVMRWPWNRVVVLDDDASADLSRGTFGTYSEFVHCNDIDGLTIVGVNKALEWFGHETVKPAEEQAA